MVATGTPKRTSLREQMLVVRCQAGDERAFIELFDRFHARTHLYLVRLLGHTEADDAQQEVWLGVYRRISGLANPGAFRTWLFQVTRNHAVDVLRKRRRHEELLSSAAAMASRSMPAKEDDLLRGVDYRRLDEAMQELTAPLRETVHLRYWEDMTYAAWVVTFVVLALYAVVIGCDVMVGYKAMTLVGNGGHGALNFMGWSVLLKAITPLLIVVGVTAMLVAVLSTIGIFVRTRTASLAEIQLRLAALERALTREED